MNICITGGLGYIGRHLVDNLCNAGHNVLVIDREDYKDQGITDFFQDKYTNFNFVHQDIHNIVVDDYFKDYKIGIVESEKTALLCDIFFEEKILWLSTGGMKGLTENKMSDLAGRNIILFPDLSSRNSKNNAFDEWKDKAKQIGKKLKMNIEINNFLELFSDESDKENQEDLGDFIIKNLHTEKKY